jgi:hypothetical protein
VSRRAELDKAFILIPVTFKGESSPDDLARDFLGTLRIDDSQCIRDAQSADDILAGIVRTLGEPETLAGDYPQTPLEVLQGGITELLSDKTTEASLLSALDAVGCKRPTPLPSTRKGYADLLARHFLLPSSRAVRSCFRTFEEALGRLSPEPDRARARELFKYVRSLCWSRPT